MDEPTTLRLSFRGQNYNSKTVTQCRDVRQKCLGAPLTVKPFSVIPELKPSDLNVILTFESVDKILKWTNQIKATEQYFPVVLCIMLYKVVLTFESVDKVLKCDHPNESY